MATIYLPNGAKLVIPSGATVSLTENGCITYYSRDTEKTLLAYVFPSGAVHILNNALHFYYPPEINTPENALKIVLENLTNLSKWDLKKLKARLQDFDARTGTWEK